MRRRVRQIKEERFRPPAVLVNEFDGVVAKGVGKIKALFGRRVRLIIHRHLAFDAFGFSLCDIEIIGPATDQSEVFIESPIDRPVRPVLANVPLARHQRSVSAELHCLGNGEAMLVQVALVGRIPFIADHVSDSGLVGIQSG